MYHWLILCVSFIDAHDVCCAINSLKSSKSDGNSGFSTDHFVNGCDELSVNVSVLFSALLIHGVAPTDVCLYCRSYP